MLYMLYASVSLKFSQGLLGVGVSFPKAVELNLRKGYLDSLFCFWLLIKGLLCPECLKGGLVVCSLFQDNAFPPGANISDPLRFLLLT